MCRTNLTNYAILFSNSISIIIWMRFNIHKQNKNLYWREILLIIQPFLSRIQDGLLQDYKDLPRGWKLSQGDPELESRPRDYTQGKCELQFVLL